MGKKVFANGFERSAKKSIHKVIAAMPDVCMSPPPPAGPLPIPYPNFSAASDTAGGSKDVKIDSQPIGGKNASEYKKGAGGEAGTKSFEGNFDQARASKKLPNPAMMRVLK